MKRHFMQNIVGLLFGFISLWLLVGCATVFNRSAGKMAFSSEPNGAQIVLQDGQEICRAPCEKRLEVAKRIELMAQKDGYQSGHKTVLRRVHYTFYLNFIFGGFGLVGLAYDWLSGNMYSLNAYKVHFDLTKNGDGDHQKEMEGQDQGIDEEDKSGSRLRNTPELVRMKERFSEAYLRKEIVYFYGSMDETKISETMDRIYLILIDMENEGERLDLDEAIRRDQFN